MPSLHFIREQQELFVHSLRNGRTLVGRSDRCDVALPSDAISRTHCMIDERPDGWWLVDRSRHGTQVNGALRTEHHLADGDLLTIGPWQARYRASAGEALRERTATMPMGTLDHEQLVEVRDGNVASCRAQITVEDGPRKGECFDLSSARTGVGGPGSTLVLGRELPVNAFYVRVVRSRPMLEPGHAAVFLEEQRVREITPILPGEIVRVGEHVLRIEPETFVEPGRETESFGDMVGSTTVMRRLFGVLYRVAAHDAPVLLTGESGTGKELAAQGIHDAGPRGEGPFVAINCAAVSDTLFESELFGHEKGSFTGAMGRADGAFHRANGGTLFLDEMGEMRLDLQAKLLRALESGEVRRVGASVAEYPDVRIIAATNRNLPQMIREGTFRQDLYYRLEVLTVRLPPLRERREDIPAIARALLKRNHPSARLSDDAIDAMVQYDWPGNIREMRNVLTRAFVMAGGVIGRGDLTFNPWAFEEGANPGAPQGYVTAAPPSSASDDEEREGVLAALRAANGNRTTAARALGIPRSSLLYKIKRLRVVYPV
jgi:two-component system response regulator HydG